MTLLSFSLAFLFPLLTFFFIFIVDAITDVPIFLLVGGKNHSLTVGMRYFLGREMPCLGKYLYESFGCENISSRANTRKRR